MLIAVEMSGGTYVGWEIWLEPVWTRCDEGIFKVRCRGGGRHRWVLEDVVRGQRGNGGRKRRLALAIQRRRVCVGA